MTTSAQSLVPSTTLTDTADVYYTSDSVKTILDKVTVCNPTNAFNVTIDVHLVPSGGAPSAANLIVVGKTVFTNTTYTFPEVVGHVMGAGETLAVKCTNTEAILRVSGRVIS